MYKNSRIVRSYCTQENVVSFSFPNRTFVKMWWCIFIRLATLLCYCIIITACSSWLFAPSGVNYMYILVLFFLDISIDKCVRYYTWLWRWSCLQCLEEYKSMNRKWTLFHICDRLCETHHLCTYPLMQISKKHNWIMYLKCNISRRLKVAGLIIAT